MSVKLTLEGADEAREDLLALDERLHKPARPLLEALAADLAGAIQENIRTEGSRLGISWPKLHPVTEKIRRFYGHGPSGPRLIRGGQLLHSVTTLAIGDDFVEVGPNLPYAAVVDRGGTWVDPKTGRSRQVQAFPYVAASDQDVDDWTQLAVEYFLGEAA